MRRRRGVTFTGTAAHARSEVVRRAADAGGIGLHAGGRVVTPDGRSTNRNAAAANAVTAGSSRSNRDAGTVGRDFVGKILLGAGPRRPAAWLRSPRLAPEWAARPLAVRRVAAAHGGDSADSGPGVVLYHARRRDSVAWPANDASDVRRAGSRDCNSVPGVGSAETSVRNP
jgi:hypothetical protein